ncbi:MAG: hypothetical protein COU08_02170 [Candidatus Harrisonbacteria bacterium CG10_big_fil_rev_8_21_14_0_10_42_17]|uniref:Uncharacterized protein n=1 Tax=Candidatus Harrisonbacteria bacterium CG10_big_fil_rev_8_21_14_0_10_42_17 TaxID=1974584 RepID=A0A2M6WI87_9BACT|nr:MAG: hypothetical protein COU08_02170 [Candidatus Harrisonbacteria bacterium CG10_big_fil_rev_8_21_14_0_10_42_17]
MTPTALVILALILGLVLFLQNRFSRPHLQWEDVLVALDSGVLIWIESLPADPNLHLPERAHLNNSYADVIYYETLREDGAVAQSVSILIAGRKGRIEMTFVNGELVAVTKNGSRVASSRFEDSLRRRAGRILDIVSEAAGSAGTSSRL